MSVSVVLLPHFARLTAQGRNAELRVTLERRVYRDAAVFRRGGGIGAAGGPTVMQLMLQRGSFTSADAQLVARVWLALTTGLFGATGVSFSRACSRRSDFRG